MTNTAASSAPTVPSPAEAGDVHLHAPMWTPQPEYVGQDVTLDVVVRKRDDKTVSSGRKMVILELANFQGVIKGKVWEEGIAAWAGIAPGALVRVTARVDKGFPAGAAPELNLKGVERLAPDHPIGDALHPRYPGDVADLRARWDQQVAQLPTAHRAVLDQLLEVVGGRERFFRAPAAKGHHHAYIHGLLDHSLEVCETATAMAAAQGVTGADLETLRLGTLVHDIGKMDEYVWEGTPIGVSKAGNLRSHVITGVQLLERARLAAPLAWEQAGVTPRLIDDVAGIIQQHHGRAAWTPTTPPKTMSAELVTTSEQAARTFPVMLDPTAPAPDAADPSRCAHPGWQRVLAALPELEQRSPRGPDDLASDPTRPSPRAAQAMVLAIGQQPGWQNAVNLDLAQTAAAWRASTLGAPAAQTERRRYSARAALLIAVEQLWTREGAELARLGLTDEHRLQFEHALLARSQGLDGIAPVEEPGPAWPLAQMAAMADAASAWMRGRLTKVEQGQPQPDGTVLSTQRGTETLLPDIDTDWTDTFRAKLRTPLPPKEPGAEPPGAEVSETPTPDASAPPRRAPSGPRR